MSNPNGNLSGFTDPEDPDWKENALARVKSRQKERSYHRKNGMYLFFDDPYRVYLDEACNRRGISLTGYGRRATAAFMAHDLGVPFSEIIQHSARPRPYMGQLPRKYNRTYDDGQDYGLWIIEGLVEP